MIGFRGEVQDLVSPLSLEECLQKLEDALAAPPDRSSFAQLGGGVPRVVGRTGRDFAATVVKLYPPAFGRLFPLCLTAYLREENGETKLHCRFAIRRFFAAAMLVVYFAMSLAAIWLFVVSFVELFRGSPYSISIGRYPSSFRFAVAPILLGLVVIVMVDAPPQVASDRRLVASFLWKVIRARPIPSPHEFRDGFEI